MKKNIIISLLALFLFISNDIFAQNQTAILSDFRRLVGEPDSNGSVTGATARMWLNMGLREFANYGAFMRDTTYVAVAGSDTLRLPVDFLYPRAVLKTLYDKKSFHIPLSDTGINTIQRLDTIVLSTARPDTLLAADIVAINFCYKKAATEKSIRPLIQVPPDSLEKIGRALRTRILPPEYLSERLDTIVLSTHRPDTILRTDVFDVVSIYKKNPSPKGIRPLIKIPIDSLEKVGRALLTRTLPSEYLSERLDTVVLSTVRPDTVLKEDVFDLIYAYKKAATDKAIRPLIQVSSDSLAKIGRALATRVLPPEFLSERLDTLIPSTTTPINTLRTDIFDIRAVYKKETGTGKLLPLVRVAADSLQKISVNPIDYYYFSGQPSPRIVFGQKRSFNDTMYLEVLVASDFYNFTGQPIPRITMGKIPTSADTLFCKVLVASDFYTFIGQPAPRLTMGKIPTSADTLFANVLVASDFFTFIGHPYPRLIMGKMPGAADTCFCQTSALLPNYSFSDTGKIATLGRGFLKFYPPIVKADTIVLNYFATMDTAISMDTTVIDSSANRFYKALEVNVRGALLSYMAELYYDRKEMNEKANKYGSRWREIMTKWGIMRGFPVVQNSK